MKILFKFIFLCIIFSSMPETFAWFLQRSPVIDKTSFFFQIINLICLTFFSIKGKIVCQDIYFNTEINKIEKKKSNLKCVNKATLRVKKAILSESSSSICPLQYVHSEINRYKVCPNPIQNLDVTSYFKLL